MTVLLLANLKEDETGTPPPAGEEEEGSRRYGQ